MQIGTSRSFGDSCGPLPWAPCSDVGVLERRLGVDVVGVAGVGGVDVVVLAGRGAPRLAEERQVRRPHRVRRGQEGADRAR